MSASTISGVSDGPIVYKIEVLSEKTNCMSGVDVAHADSLNGGEAVEVIWVLGHAHYLRYDGRARPVNPEDLSQFLKVDRSGLTNAVYGVAEPRHAEIPKLLVKEGLAELRRKERDVFDDRLAHAPRLVFRQLYDCGQKALREKVYANHWDHIMAIREYRERS